MSKTPPARPSGRASTGRRGDGQAEIRRFVRTLERIKTPARRPTEARR
jgi:hypothetical protein